MRPSLLTVARLPSYYPYSERLHNHWRIGSDNLGGLERNPGMPIQCVELSRGLELGRRMVDDQRRHDSVDPDRTQCGDDHLQRCGIRVSGRIERLGYTDIGLTRLVEQLLVGIDQLLLRTQQLPDSHDRVMRIAGHLHLLGVH